jgi:hypothetical protein
MNNLQEIQKQIAELQKAFKLKLLSTNDYCSMIHSLYQQEKKLILKSK